MRIVLPYIHLVRINAPELFRDPEFVAWLNRPSGNRTATWHVKGQEPDEWGDVFFTYEDGEGSDADMPERIWDDICELLRPHVGCEACFVWLTNIEEKPNEAEHQGTSEVATPPEPDGVCGPAS